MVYSPAKQLSVDESLVLFKGRLAFKQFIRTKRARFGIRLYELCTSNGIMLDVLVYCGCGIFFNDEMHSDMPSTERIPSVLMNEFLNKGHMLYTNNYYTSPTLAILILQNGTHLVGTVRNNRCFFAKDLVKVDLEKGKAEFCANKYMMTCKFCALQDKSGNKQKVVYMLSTCHDTTIVDTGKKAHPSGDPIMKPAIISSYNSHMGGVDRVDQQLHGVQALRRAYKWYKKLAVTLYYSAF